MSTPGGNTRLVLTDQLQALQEIVTEMGAEAYAGFLRLGGSQRTVLQPITSRALLAEMERFMGDLPQTKVPGVLFYGDQGAIVGGLYPPTGHLLSASEAGSLQVTTDGLRMVVPQLPPPAGFRSRPSLPRGQFECYFESLRVSPSGWEGTRTAAMGQSTAPVSVPALPLPSPARWDFAKVADRDGVAWLSWVETAATEVFRDVLHALTSACDDSLRQKVPLLIRRE